MPCADTLNRLCNQSADLAMPCSTMFWIDLIALLPLDFVVMCATVYSEGDVSAWALDYFQMFRMLRLVSDPEASPPQSPSTTAAMLENRVAHS